MLKKNLSVKYKERLKKKLYFNLDNSSLEFKSIFNKYKIQKKIQENKQMSILYLFDKEREKAINKESEQEFLFKDLKKLRKINDELLNQYGEKSKQEYHEIKKPKFDSKLAKNNFMDIIDDNKSNISLSINANNEIQLPNINQEKSILEYNYIKKENSFDKEKMIRTNINNLKSLNRSSFFTLRYNKSNIENIKKIKLNNFNYSNNRNKKQNIFNTFKKYNKSVNNSLNNSLNKKKNKNTELNNIKKYIHRSNDTSINKSLNCISYQKPIIKNEMSYIDTLDNIKEKSIREEKIYKHLFLRHNIKTKASNEKFNFMMKKYFS